MISVIFPSPFPAKWEKSSTGNAGKSVLNVCLHTVFFFFFLFFFCASFGYIDIFLSFNPSLLLKLDV